MSSEQNVAEGSNVTVKILNALYVGGAYGLILMTVVQVLILVSWIRHG
ncbi:hypothetical protein SIID45300_02064 [Candidatus Magnetaquicoccaceae bacterium FCR-1]|uniref:Uncharacterized protein n=1 Tax=Candidatus Magnetaquiglobus chichijimensis TaxID=3141448 RepID=A0ABQ0CA14_9PROT